MTETRKLSNATRTWATGPASSDITKVNKLSMIISKLSHTFSCRNNLSVTKFVFCGVFFPRRRDHGARMLDQGQGWLQARPSRKSRQHVYRSHCGMGWSLFPAQVYYKECETNSYGEGTEKFCYCNFYLCNRASANSLYAFPLLCLLPLWWLCNFSQTSLIFLD